MKKWTLFFMAAFICCVFHTTLCAESFGLIQRDQRMPTVHKELDSLKDYHHCVMACEQKHLKKGKTALTVHPSMAENQHYKSCISKCGDSF